jgi:hypothetical protein
MKQITDLLALSMRLVLAFAGLTPLLAADPAVGNKTDAAVAPAKTLKLPGLVINPTERCVDVEAAICLDQGALELIACTKDSKEHESIVAVEARPLHIHTALLLLGAKNGNPAMRRPINKERTQWVDIPPQGDPIEVFLVWKDPKGTVIERPIGDFMVRSDKADDDAATGQKKEKFPHTFLFAGSLLGDPGETPRKYLAEASGNVISISTFGDEVLCLPEVYSRDNGALEWQIDPTHLPKLRSKVTLRLRCPLSGRGSAIPGRDAAPRQDLPLRRPGEIRTGVDKSDSADHPRKTDLPIDRPQPPRHFQGSGINPFSPALRAAL